MTGMLSPIFTFITLLLVYSKKSIIQWALFLGLFFIL